MTPSDTTYEGEIWFGTEADKAKLRRMGVELLEETEGGGHKCRLSEETLRKLDPHWGYFFWALTPTTTRMEAAGDEYTQERRS